MSPALTSIEAADIRRGLASPWCKSLGGKRKLLPEINSIIKKFDMTIMANYHEPFVGGGAMFYEAQAFYPFNSYRLADANLALIATYKVIRDDVEELIARMQFDGGRGLPNTVEGFKVVRDNFNDLIEHIVQSSRYTLVSRQTRITLAHEFIFLNKTCFNGLWRVNASGRFNVPFAHYPKPTICDADNLRRCSTALQGVKLFATDFASTPVKSGDLVFIDSPYLPVSATSSFVGYTAEGFKMTDHIRLRDKAVEWKALGANVLLCNSDTPLTRELYRGWNLREVQMARTVNSKGSGRGKVGELLIY